MSTHIIFSTDFIYGVSSFIQLLHYITQTAHTITRDYNNKEHETITQSTRQQQAQYQILIITLQKATRSNKLKMK